MLRRAIGREHVQTAVSRYAAPAGLLRVGRLVYSCALLLILMHRSAPVQQAHAYVRKRAASRSRTSNTCRQPSAVAANSGDSSRVRAKRVTGAPPQRTCAAGGRGAGLSEGWLVRWLLHTVNLCQS